MEFAIYLLMYLYKSDPSLRGQWCNLNLMRGELNQTSPQREGKEGRASRVNLRTMQVADVVPQPF